MFEVNPSDFIIAMLIFFWLIKEISVFEIPIPAMSIALIETKERNWENYQLTF